MLNLGYVNHFGSGVNTVSTLLDENGNYPAEFLLSDYSTFKVVVKNADVIEDSTNITERTSHIIVNVTNNDEVGTIIGTYESVDCLRYIKTKNAERRGLRSSISFPHLRDEL